MFLPQVRMHISSLNIRHRPARVATVSKSNIVVIVNDHLEIFEERLEWWLTLHCGDTARPLEPMDKLVNVAYAFARKLAVTDDRQVR